MKASYSASEGRRWRSPRYKGSERLEELLVPRSSVMGRVDDGRILKLIGRAATLIRLGEDAPSSGDVKREFANSNGHPIYTKVTKPKYA